MSQITRLRTRLKNVEKSTTEYRMTVVEAKKLLQEIDTIINTKEQEKPIPQVARVAPIIKTTRTIDGGTF